MQSTDMKISFLLGLVVAAFGRMACDKGDNGSTPDGTPADLLAETYGAIRMLAAPIFRAAVPMARV